MAEKVYRFRLAKPGLSEDQLGEEVGYLDAAVTANAGGVITDITVEENNAQDVKDALAEKGHTFVEENPTTSPEEEFDTNVTSAISIQGTLTQTSGNSHKVIYEDVWSALEINQNKSGFGIAGFPVDKTVANNIKIRVRWVLKSDGSGTYVRIGVKTFPRSDAEDITIASADDLVVIDAVDISAISEGELVSTDFTLDKTKFTNGDEVSLHVGRDGHNDIVSGESDDDFGKPVDILSVRILVN